MTVNEIFEQLKQFNKIDCYGIKCSECPLHKMKIGRLDDICSVLIEISEELREED